MRRTAPLSGRARPVARAALAAVAAASALAGASAAGSRPPARSEHDEQVLVRRARYPVRIVETRQGACDALSPDRVEMTLDGARAEIDAIERNRLRTVHAVLIDTSPSMKKRGRLERATRAARGYIGSLPPDEPVLLATFDEDFVLRDPPTLDREGLNHTLDTIDTGTSTALHDALYHTIRYLAPLPERKVVVVVTDGCDTASLTAHTFQAVLELAGETEDLSVFPIGIELPQRCPGPPAQNSLVEGPDTLLHRLGSASGGELTRVEQAGDYSFVFATIRQRLEQEGHLVYRPPATPRAPNGTRARRRAIRIRSLDLKGCRVRRAGSWSTFDGISEYETAAFWKDTVLDSAALPRFEPLELRFPSTWRGKVEGGPGFLELRQDHVIGSLPDIEVDRGPLYSGRSYDRSGRYRVALDAYGSYRQRVFRLAVPDSRTARHPPGGPAALVRWLLEEGEPPFERDEDGEMRLAPGWIHGQTLLEARGLLGRVLYSYPGYRDWADARLWSMEREHLRRLLDDSGLDEAASRAFLEAVERRGYEPRQQDPQRVLADWLGDLTLSRLLTEIDREGVAAAIRGADEPSEARVRESWATLLEWFPPPTRVRIVAPLIPVYEAAKDVFGFYRIVQPVALRRQPPGGLPPAAPLGTLLARRLAPSDGARLKGLEYPDIDRATRRALQRFARVEGGGELRAVRLELIDATGNVRSATGHFLLGGDAWSREARERPKAVLACVDLDRDPAWRPRTAEDLRSCDEIRAASR